MTRERDDKVKELMKRSAAFSDFKERGLDFVARNYPDQLHFVNKNKERDYVVVTDKIAAQIRTVTLQ